ncbi:site-specific integrase, partial [Candidatus Peregrinibacteria bacterium]|nr:site-specific integrase [Candidatus Peregrinibacteria bacterium]
MKDPEPHSPLAQAANRYLQYLQAEENKSPLTIRNYRQSLDILLALCPARSPADIAKETVRAYKQALHEFRARNGNELSIRTKNHHLTILRALLRYLVQEEELDVLSPDCVKRFKEES